MDKKKYTELELKRYIYHTWHDVTMSRQSLYEFLMYTTMNTHDEINRAIDDIFQNAKDFNDIPDVITNRFEVRDYRELWFDDIFILTSWENMHEDAIADVLNWIMAKRIGNEED